MKSDVMYWTPVNVAVPDDDRQVLLCKQAKNGSVSYSLGYYDGERFVTMGVAKVTHWIDFSKLKIHTDQVWRRLKCINQAGFIWKEDTDD